MRVRFALRTYLVLLSLASIVSVHAQNNSHSYDSVNPFIGTAGDGDTFPAASMPFGMMQWGPDTNSNAWYFYNEKQIQGFSLTHLSGAGCGLYGDFAVLPVLSTLAASPATNFAPYAAAFDHSNEQAHPGYYAVTLANGIRVEITVAERSGIARFIFPQGTSARLLVNAGSSANIPGPADTKGTYHDAFEDRIQLQSDRSFSGSVTAGGFCSRESSYKLYATGRFNKPYKSSALWQNDTVLPGAKSAHGKRTGAWLGFGDVHEVELKIGISFVSKSGALNNLDKEIPGWDFDAIQAKARTAWRDSLDRIAVEGGTPEQQIIFSTGVYHSFLAPTLFSDQDGSYIGFDNKVHNLRGSKQGAQYANFFDWDIYRNTVQWQALFYPERESDMMQSLVNDAVQSSWFPRWPAANDVTYVMNGDSPVIVLAEAYAFGAHNFDTKTALKYMLKAGTQAELGPHNDAERPFLEEYRKLGYVPSEKDPVSASRTLEYASADFAIAQFARTLGDQVSYRSFLKQSENWKNLLDPATGWMRPRADDGSWIAGFDAERSLPKKQQPSGNDDQEGFEEGNTYQYTYMVPFDYPALFAAIGGNDQVIPRLDKFFLKLRCWDQPCFNIENEPDFVVPYAYVFAGQPWKTQEVVTRIASDTFKAAPNGIPGNDDLGATSGVYVWNALGFYPAVPGVAGVVLGTPMFDKATLRLSGGRTLIVTRKGSGIYVQRVALDGKPYTNSWLPLSKLHSGATELQFTVDTQPNKQRGSAVSDLPPSFR
jgi:predicted alpha-1,2-mannosidase